MATSKPTSKPAQPEMVRVQNTRATFLTTPPTPSFPLGHRLGPGGNNVPEAHIKELEDLDPAKGPGKVWNQWKTLEWVKPLEGEESKRAVKEPEGPPAPRDLTDRRPEAAEAMVAVESRVEILQGWLGAEKREPVRNAIKTRLAALGVKD